jgi:hypothetical protein
VTWANKDNRPNWAIRRVPHHLGCPDWRPSFGRPRSMRHSAKLAGHDRDQDGTGEDELGVGLIPHARTKRRMQIELPFSPFRTPVEAIRRQELMRRATVHNTEDAVRNRPLRPLLLALRGKAAPASSRIVKQRHPSFGILDECGLGAGSRRSFLARGRGWHGRPGDGPTDVTQQGVSGPTETDPSRPWPGGRVLLVTPHSAGPPRNCERAFGGIAMVPYPRRFAISMP